MWQEPQRLLKEVSQNKATVNGTWRSTALLILFACSINHHHAQQLEVFPSAAYMLLLANFLQISITKPQQLHTQVINMSPVQRNYWNPMPLGITHCLFDAGINLLCNYQSETKDSINSPLHIITYRENRFVSQSQVFKCFFWFFSRLYYARELEGMMIFVSYPFHKLTSPWSPLFGVLGGGFPWCLIAPKKACFSLFQKNIIVPIEWNKHLPFFPDDTLTKRVSLQRHGFLRKQFT